MTRSLHVASRRREAPQVVRHNYLSVRQCVRASTTGCGSRGDITQCAFVASSVVPRVATGPLTCPLLDGGRNRKQTNG